MTTRKSSAWLALLLSFLIAFPPAGLADDTELFTTTANPNVLLMLDTTGSMDTVADTSVADLDGDSPSSSRMDILWKVIYTLLNADLSVPTYPSTSTTTVTCTLYSALRSNGNTNNSITSGRNYQSITVVSNDTNWSQFPSTAQLRIGSGGVSETFTYNSKSAGSPYTFYFSSSKSFSHDYPRGATISYTYTVSGPPVDYPENYPTNHTEAISTDFLNNLTAADEEILKARLGLMTFTTSSGTVRTIIRNQIQPTDNNVPPFDTSYRDIWTSTKTYAHASGGTPTAKALQAAQGFFNTATTNNTVDICRQNFAVMVTDGEDTMGGLDGATGNGAGPDYYSSGVFKADGWSSGSNTGQVARNNSVIQQAANLKNYAPSVKLFTVGVGISDTQPHMAALREVLRRAAEQNNTQATSAQFDAIGASGDNTSRAADKAFFASDATELSIALRNIFQQITAGMYSFTAPTVASVRMTDRNYLYKASFTPAPPPATFWEGHLQALTINPDNTISAPLWDADNVLRSTSAGSRMIYTGTTSDNVHWDPLAFTTGNVSAAMLGVDNDTVAVDVVNYVLGVGRTSKLGDIFHSKPVVVGPPSRFFFDEGYATAVGSSQSFADAKATRKRVVYVGTNDGMLHAFLSGTYHSSTQLYDGGTGEELFGYVPRNLLDSLENYLPGDLTRHGYYVDSSPRVADVWIDTNSDGIKQTSEWRTVLIGGFRKGGNGYFALDVTDPGNGTDATSYSNYPKVLWEYTMPATGSLSWSEPFIGKVRMQENSSSAVKDRWVAIFGGGKSDTGAIGSSLVVLDIATGTPLVTFSTPIDNVVPAPPTAVLDASGYIRYVYVSDLDGSLYKFRFTATGVRTTGFSEWDAKKIFQAPAGQPTYHRVESSSISEGSRYLFFGTGDQETPVSNLGTGKFYAIQDTDAFWPGTPLTESNLTNLSSSITNVNGGTVAVGRSGWFVSFASVPSTSNDTNTHTGEKVLSDPVVFFNNVFFTTFTPDVSNACGGGGIARVYGLQVSNAGAGLAGLSTMGETATKVPYHVFTGSTEGSPGGIPSSPSLSIYPSGQSSIFIGFSTGAVQEVKIESPTQMKTIKSWKETF